MRQWAKAVLISDYGFVEIVEIKNKWMRQRDKTVLSYNYGSFKIVEIKNV